MKKCYSYFTSSVHCNQKNKFGIALRIGIFLSVTNERKNESYKVFSSSCLFSTLNEIGVAILNILILKMFNMKDTK